MIKKGRKIAYLVSFILKLSMIVLFFLINGLSNAEIRLSESASFFQDETIIVQTHNSGECTYNAISPGKIDISVGKNEHAGDVTIQVTVKDISYDDSYDREVVGNRMSEFKDLVPSKEGPWELCFQFALENKSFKNIISDTKSYDVIFNGKSYNAEVIQGGSTNRTKTDFVTVNKGDTLTLTVNLGSKADNSALPEGEYCLHLSLERGELNGNDALEKIGFGRIVTLGYLSYRHAFLKMQMSDIFNFNNILGIIVLLYSIGTAVYFYPDLRSAKHYYDKQLQEVYSGPIGVVKTTFYNPYTGYTYTTTSTATSGPSIVLVLLKTTFFFVALVVFMPVRFFVFLVKDLISAFSGKKPFSVLYGLGCFLGSVGMWLILGSLVFFLALNWIIGGILAAVGIGGLIGAHFLTSEYNMVEDDD
ncbi:MAG: hypothetical protein K6F14_07850 [Clostridiales bacterium]|nr:hypothetical protein [Clostridiales bacterium]